MEVDRQLEPLAIPKATRRILDPLDLRVQSLRDRVRERVGDVVEHVVEVASDDPGHVDHWPESRANRPGLPTREERAGCRDRAVVPEAAERFLHRPRPGRLQRAAAQAAKLASGGCREVRARDARFEPEELGASEAVIASLPKHTVLAPPDLVHRFDHVAHHVEPVEDDLEVAIGHIITHGAAIRVPHVHDHGLNGEPLLDRQPVEILGERLGRAIVGDVQHRLALEIDDHRDELKVLQVGMLVDAEIARRGSGPAGESAADRAFDDPRWLRPT